MLYLSIFACLVWLITIGLPWRAWQTHEVLDAEQGVDEITVLNDITVVIPARNEARVIEVTLLALTKQGQGLKIILVDDESSDGTAEKARQTGVNDLTILSSTHLPKGWSGKLWAQHQGVQRVKTPLTLLLDADIELQPGILTSLKNKRDTENLQFISLMAMLNFSSFWEKLLMPAFIYFFKLLYPFALSNQPGHKMAAAAGGCILMETQIIEKMGGMVSIKDAVIDDCTLAKRVKSAGHKTWVGLTHNVISQRSYVTLAEIWDMVARTAYTQLYYSIGLLLACTALMLLMYWLPLYGLLFFQGTVQFLNTMTFTIMMIAYMPTLRFYSLSLLWSLLMPVIAGLFLLMTWTSAIRFWRGERSRWKGRTYQNI